jgi:tRNA-2-methylthio-N6-dimethylallyladenosine synthase
VRTFGCQGNVADGETIKGLLESMGYALTEDIDTADFILYNTCAVREHAQDRVYGNVGALKPLKESRPELFIALCGCMMQQDHVVAKIKKSYPFVNLVFGTHVFHKLQELVYRALCGSRRVYETTCSDSRIAEDLPVHRDSGFKAWLPVMYGCNNYCSYCVVPYVRGRERSRDPERVLAQAAELVAAVTKRLPCSGKM